MVAASTSWLAIYIGIGWVIRLLMVPVILRRQFAPGAAVAWLGIIFLHPIIGLTLYTLLGETRLGPHRVERHRALVDRFRSELRNAVGRDDSTCSLQLSPEYDPMVRQADKISGLPVLGGNSLELLTEDTALIERLVADIDSATSHVHLLYYIFAPDKTGKRVADAVVRASQRGVKCRVLVDAVASRTFFHKGCGLSERLKAGGVSVQAAFPSPRFSGGSPEWICGTTASFR
ncbi:MAG TPA: phospholipase D-like domain-containing protein [Tepidisphaeraceae bacterium]|nr:phospholipase D-like domain-containing protein [Tepidisphaeraceae bacterium]